MFNQEIRPLKETGEHSYLRRAFGHNYYAPFIYHIILKKAADCEVFGHVVGDARIRPGNPGAAAIQESMLGRIIAKAIIRLPFEFPILKNLQYSVMPDHVHMLLQVRYKSDKHLDYYFDCLKQRIASKYSEKVGNILTPDNIFEPGYCDKPLYDNRSLDCLYTYIRENPHRLAMRIQFPDFFRRTRNLNINDKAFVAYGNLFLLRNPDKKAVKISRKFTPDEKERLTHQWLSDAARGTVLVSPFISKTEKDIREEAESLNAKIILITHETFTERFKPAAHNFALCEQGRLLIISLGMPPKTELTRQHCLAMNALAEIISNI